MVDAVAGVVLAAGAGTRLEPLTRLRPKPLCPVGNVALVDLAIERVRSTSTADDHVAVNIHHGRAAMDAHLTERWPEVHLSVEERLPLGTAGALGFLRGWLAGRHALVVNADAWCPGSLAQFVEGWDHARVRLLLAGDDDLHPRSRIAAALMPWTEIEGLAAEPSGLYEACWRRAQATGCLDVVRHDGPFVDCGTPADYLAANLTCSGGESVVGPGADVRGTIDRCVVWPGASVYEREHLTRAIRTDAGVTVHVR